jgi:chromosome segregation ATPase
MKRLLFLVPLLFASCSTVSTSSSSEKERMEVAIHKIRTDLEEMKCDLGTCQMELHILEGKMTNHEDHVASIRDETLDAHDRQLQQFLQKIKLLDKKLTQVTKKQTDIYHQLQDVSKHSGDMHLALAEYQDKFNSLESFMHDQRVAIHEMQRMKEDLTSLFDSQTVHVVQAGESLDKIAEKYQVSVDEIKKANHIRSDLLMTGQHLVIPEKIIAIHYHDISKNKSFLILNP